MPKLPELKFLRLKKEKIPEKEAKPRFQPWVTSYLILGDKIDRFLPYFKGLGEALGKTDLGIHFKAYVSLIFFATMISFVVSFAISIPLLLLLGGFSLIQSLMYGLALSAGASFIVFLILYLYPYSVASSLGGKIDSSLPFGVNYMAIFTSAGISPERTFRSMASASEMEGLDIEARKIVRDVMLLGEDILTVMDRASRSTPSTLFSELLKGYTGTVRAGGDVTSYVTDRARHIVELRKLSLRKFIDSLGMISEIYVSALIAAPLLMIIMFTTMGMMGGAGMIDPTQLLFLLTYVFIPILSIIFLAWIHAITPKI